MLLGVFELDSSCDGVRSLLTGVHESRCYLLLSLLCWVLYNCGLFRILAKPLIWFTLWCTFEYLLYGFYWLIAKFKFPPVVVFNIAEAFKVLESKLLWFREVGLMFDILRGDKLLLFIWWWLYCYCIYWLLICKWSKFYYCCC